MKRIIVVTVVFALALLAGCGEKADPIDMPSNGAVTSIEVVTLGGAKVDITENLSRPSVHNADGRDYNEFIYSAYSVL